ncbi:hypothetical protein [Nostoc sp.]
MAIPQDKILGRQLEICLTDIINDFNSVLKKYGFINTIIASFTVKELDNIDTLSSDSQIDKTIIKDFNRVLEKHGFIKITVVSFTAKKLDNVNTPPSHFSDSETICNNENPPVCHP